MQGLDMGEDLCSSCTHFYYGQMDPVNASGGASTGPDGELYVLSWQLNFPMTNTANDIWQIDIANNNAATLIMDGPDDMDVPGGLAAVGNGIFYTLTYVTEFNDTLYRWDANAGTIEAVGSLPFLPWSDIWIANDELYCIAYVPFPNQERMILRIDTSNPENSEVLCSFDYSWGIYGFTATTVADVFVGIETQSGPSIVSINIHDCSISTLCDDLGEFAGFSSSITSIYEHDDPLNHVYLDLDCNDSSGAANADYNSSSITCLDTEGALINDIDSRIFISALISEMTLTLTNPIDGADEFLEMNGSINGINISGSGSSTIILTNQNSAKASDFIDALDQIRYHNNAFYPTGGIRIVEVQFTLTNGEESNVASAFIEVVELPQLEIDLGPDLQVCSGESILLDAGYPGSVYEWSTGGTQQTELVNNEDQYSVTVSNSTLCSGTDTIEVELLPVYSISLTGDSIACIDGSAILVIHHNAPFAITVEIESTPGGTFEIEVINNNYEFTEFPVGDAEYHIINVSSSEPACFEVVDGYHGIEIFPHYHHTSNILLCNGDSILLGTTWIHETGDYSFIYQSIFGCDSIVEYFVEIDNSNIIYFNETTCELSEAGIFITTLPNPTGCDTIIQTIVSLLPADTSYLISYTCNSLFAGTFINSFPNAPSCDSIVISTVVLLPPVDTTFLTTKTCDSTEAGVSTQILLNIGGCDSLIINSVTLLPPDTTFHFGVSCDPSQIGVHLDVFSNVFGCDSLTILTIYQGQADTTLVETTTCDSSAIGIFEEHFTTVTKCDSVVISKVSYSANDSTFITGSSCEPIDTGVFVSNYNNRFGCDSIVTTTISLLSQSETFIFSTTCDSALAGVFIRVEVNQDGCDSVVIETITLNPTHHIFVEDKTCDVSKSGIFNSSLKNQYGCDSLVTLTVVYFPPDTTYSTSFTCFEDETSTQEILFVNQNGCDSFVIITTILYQLPVFEIQSEGDYNGYDISCFGSNNGEIYVSGSGVGPFEFSWKSQDTLQFLKELQPGTYYVTITDANGCKAIDSIELIEPPPLYISLEINNPDCFKEREGSITVQASGGVDPYLYSLDGIIYQASPTFGSLSEGSYTVTVKDANQCERNEIIWINVPLQAYPDLGMDQFIMAYDSILITALVNIPYDSLAAINWSGVGPGHCNNCLSQVVAPIITTTYSVTITSIDGCVGSDQMEVFVEINDHIYAPSVFSPNEDQMNDRWRVYSGNNISNIELLEIYDRWGNLVYAARDFHPDDDKVAWDGRMKNKVLDPAVFVFHLIAITFDRRKIHLKGDITLLR